MRIPKTWVPILAKRIAESLVEKEMIRISVTPDARNSSTMNAMDGLSMSGSISFGTVLVAGRKRVP